MAMRDYSEKVNHPEKNTLGELRLVKACSNPKCPEKMLIDEEAVKWRMRYLA